MEKDPLQVGGVFGNLRSTFPFIGSAWFQSLLWLLLAIGVFGTTNVYYSLGYALGMGVAWKSGPWAKCGGAVHFYYIVFAMLIMLSACIAGFYLELRKSMFRLLCLLTGITLAIPLWMPFMVEVFCGPRPW